MADLHSNFVRTAWNRDEIQANPTQHKIAMSRPRSRPDVRIGHVETFIMLVLSHRNKRRGCSRRLEAYSSHASSEHTQSQSWANVWHQELTYHKSMAWTNQESELGGSAQHFFPYLWPTPGKCVGAPIVWSSRKTRRVTSTYRKKLPFGSAPPAPFMQMSSVDSTKWGEYRHKCGEEKRKHESGQKLV